MTYKYQSLIKVLDKILSDAPEKLKQRRYSMLDGDISHSRSLAYIHLYLMARHGVVSFEERDKHITDGSYDGGVDAFYIDNGARVIYVIQAKFRTNSSNFSDKKIDAEELLAMDVNRISKGEEHDVNGNEYNGRIKGFQRELKNLKNSGMYDWKVIVLANSDYSKEQLNKLTGGIDAEVFDCSKAYNKLLFPVISGNYYDPDELQVSINLANVQHPRIQYEVNLGAMNSSITVLFVPTLEIAKVLHKYKNSILKYNPRSYLEMRRNSVNDEIRNTILNCDNNEFALFNNGITLISSDCSFCDTIGVKNKAQLSLKMPQIINGGQTAFTLSRIYEQCVNDGDTDFSPFVGKEVLVKVISFPKSDGQESGYDNNVIELIEKISKATNSQNPIDAADKRANDIYHVKFQRFVFDRVGLYYERKRGEFADGLKSGYISRDLLIKRDDLIRCCLASDGKPGEARRANKKHLFSDAVAEVYLSKEIKFENYVSSYLCYQEIKTIEANEKCSTDKYSQEKYGNAFRYGKYAVVSAYSFIKNNLDSNVDIHLVLSKWLSFEEHVKVKHKDKFFKKDNNMLNYYKSSDVSADIAEYFGH